MKFLVAFIALVGASNAYFFQDMPMMSFQNEEMRPRYLTCNNAEVLNDGTPVFVLAVTISDRSDNLRGFGGVGRANWWNPMMQQSQDPGSLSAKIEVLTTSQSGNGLVAFTSKSQPEDGCALQGSADFGSNLLGSDGLTSKLGFGMNAMGMGFGMGGFGHPMGFGLDRSFNVGDGVVAEVPITAGRVSSLSIEGLPFENLEDLAGRGVVICSSVASEFSGNPVCERPFFACCSLNYDDRPQSLV